jgi:DNA modification methylase/DNA-directed RNA polymerase subunit RPC12/RpoP
MFQDTNQNQPVTVLGKTFNSEEERRNYFREELRKHLPELKKMESFPSGEDEDILNLSDPPFFTACPNPWLNELIIGWEEEKKNLERQGERNIKFNISEPYVDDISFGKKNPIYRAHSYHTKVPHYAIMKFLLYYTQPGDIVLDGFSGTGMTGVASQMLKEKTPVINQMLGSSFQNRYGVRFSVQGDLSPVAGHIATNFNSKWNIESVEKSLNDIFDAIEKKFGKFYLTHHTNNIIGRIDYTIWSDIYLCSECNSEIKFWDSAVVEENVLDNFDCQNCGVTLTKRKINKAMDTIWDDIRKESIQVPKKYPALINYSVNNKRYTKKPDDFDLKQIEDANNALINFKLIKLPNGVNLDQPIRSHSIEYLHDFYHRRSLLVLNEFYKLANLSDNRNQLLFLFSSVAAMRLNRRMPFRSGGKSAGAINNLSIPSLSQEYNAIDTMGRKWNDIKKSKIYFNPNVNQAITSVQSATNWGNLNNNSIDYIFVDPPFGANIMYSDLNFLNEAWLGVITNIKEEAIQNKQQNKGFLEYQNLMLKSFSEFYRLLKPGKWMTVEFSNTSAAIWNSIQTAIQNTGFIIANVAALDKQEGSFKAVTTATAVKQDLIISCYKPSSEFDMKFKNNQHTNVGVWDFIEEHLNHLPIHIIVEKSTLGIIERTPKILFDRLISFFVQRSLPVPIDAGKFQQGLKEHFIERDGMFFTNEQVQEYDLKKKEVPNFIQLSILVSSEQDGVLWLKNFLHENPLNYQDIQPQWMQALAGVRKGDVIPELAVILEENFLKDDSGKWYTPNPENEIDLEKLRSKRLLKQFESYKSEVLKPKGKLKEVRVEALRAGFKQCYQDKDFKTIVTIGDRIPSNLLMEDEVLLQFYDIASSRV